MVWGKNAYKNAEISLTKRERERERERESVCVCGGGWVPFCRMELPVSERKQYTKKSIAKCWLFVVFSFEFCKEKRKKENSH